MQRSVPDVDTRCMRYRRDSDKLTVQRKQRIRESPWLPPCFSKNTIQTSRTSRSAQKSWQAGFPTWGGQGGESPEKGHVAIKHEMSFQRLGLCVAEGEPCPNRRSRLFGERI